MALNSVEKERKRKDIRLEYKKWIDKKWNGIQMYHDDFIVAKLAEKFYLRPRTIENILYSRI